MADVSRLDAFQRRHPWAALPIAVGYKFVDDQGTYLAALLTYYGFLSVFPLLLLGVTALGFVLRDDPGAQQAVLSSALSNFPVVGDQLRANVGSLQGSWVAVVIGIGVALFGALGVTHALQYTLNQVWAVPKAIRPSIQATYGRGVLMLVLVGVGLALTTGLSAVTTSAAGSLDVGQLTRIGTTILSTALNIGLFLLTYRLLTPRRLPVRDVWIGSVVAGVAWQLVLVLGTYLLGTRLQGASATYGLFGIVLGLGAWIYLAAMIYVICAELDAVVFQRLYPRSLSSPFPDNDHTTSADRRALTLYAEIERQKDNQTIDVGFAPATPDEPAPPDTDGSTNAP